MNLEQIYAEHPLSERSILARLKKQGRSGRALTEWDLALDAETGITDQNHSGGVDAVLALGAAAGIDRYSKVVDIGAGLGGSARVLAAAFGCQVLCIERDLRRCRDATSLTARVGLQQLVSVKASDALQDTPSVGLTDVLWGQAAWIHFPNPGEFLDRWLPALNTGGRVAMSDAFLGREATNTDESAVVKRLEESWSAHLHPISTWIDALTARGCRTLYLQDTTADSVHSFESLRRHVDRWPHDLVTAAERESWRRALEGFSAGLIRAYQLVATRRTDTLD